MSLLTVQKKIENFENFQRADKQCIKECIASFDSKYRQLEKLKIKLSNEILAFKLLRGANFSEQQKMIVLTRVNYANRETLYEDTKQSLKKFMGNVTKRCHLDCNDGIASDLFDKHEKELSEAGFVKQRSGGINLRNFKRGRYRGVDVQASCKGKMRKKMNPTGINGRILRCKSCGSFRHLVAECPDSWENMENNCEQKYGKWPNWRCGERSRGSSMYDSESKGKYSMPMPAINAKLIAEVATLRQT